MGNKMTYEAVRTGSATGFQRCGHLHRSKKAAIKCAARLNKISRANRNWRATSDL